MEFTFLEVHLDHTTAVLAAGHRAVCIFVNDECGADVLQQLSTLGVVFPPSCGGGGGGDDGDGDDDDDSDDDDDGDGDRD